MKKILQISKYYYPFLGGTEQVARNIANVINKMNDVQQKIICFNSDASDGVFVCNHEKTVHEYVDGVEVIRCGYQVKISSQAISISYAKELKKIMNDFEPDMIILHYPNPFVTHYLLKYKHRKFKLVIYWHLDITKQKILKHFFYRQNVRLINRADKIIGATPKHINDSEFSLLFEGKKQILPYTIDEKNLTISDEEITYANEIRDKYKDEILGFFIGRHVPYKGLRYLIEASKKLEKLKIHFIIAGNGELTETLKKQAKNDPKIEFIGKITDNEKRSYLYACDIICFPSVTKNEGFGLALAEGMYFAKPAVTFNIPGSGVNYVNLDRVTGIECPNSDSTAYANAIKELAQNDSIRKQYGADAKKRIKENFTTENFEKNIVKLFLNI